MTQEEAKARLLSTQHVTIGSLRGNGQETQVWTVSDDAIWVVTLVGPLDKPTQVGVQEYDLQGAKNMVLLLNRAIQVAEIN